MFNKLVDFSSAMSFSSSVQYHGLFNKGATCYLNSILQVLFMTKDFREAVQRPASDNYTGYIDGHLKELFDELLTQTGDTSSIIKALGIDREYEQQDAVQYFERILKLTSPEAVKIFRGEMAHRTVCGTCQTMTDVDGPFLQLPLQMLESPREDYSVMDGISTFFQTTVFSGDNQMFCDKCDDKVDATSQYVIKHHPDVLILLLKRFDFSHSYTSYFKINCVVDVPCSVNIPENQAYELYAVVDHFGDLRGGHYTTTIKSQDEEDQWFIFDDSRVTRVNYHLFQDNETEKSSSAYLLIYKTGIGAQNIMEQPTNEGSPRATSENCGQSLHADEQEAVCIENHSEVINMRAGPQSHQMCDKRTSLNLGDSPQEAPVKDLERGRGQDVDTQVPETRMETDVEDKTRNMELNTRDEHQSKRRASSPKPHNSEDVKDQEGLIDGECSSQKSRLVYKVIETDCREVPSDGAGSSRTKEMISEIKVGTIKRLVKKNEEAVNRKSDTANDAMASLPTGVSRMTLDESPVAKQPEHRTNSVTGKAAGKKKEVNFEVHKLNDLCGPKAEAVRMKYIHQKGFSHKKKWWCNSGLMARKRRRVQNRTKARKIKRQKNVNWDSEADSCKIHIFPG